MKHTSNPNWKKAESLVVAATGGKLTPGSGNSKIKGDIRIDDDWFIEVKQTDLKSFSIKKEWLDKLEVQRKNYDICLVIFFELRGYPYYFYPEINPEYESWSTISTTEENLPECLYTQNGTWKKEDYQTLHQLKTS